MVRVEDAGDIPFWQSVLSVTCPGRHFKFWPYSQKGTNRRITGKSYLMKYVSQADSRMFIAVDSDFDYLRGNQIITASNCVWQTYTYSWENHYCYASSLQKVWFATSSSSFNFEVFLRCLSQVVYKPLVILLVQKMQKRGSITLSALESCILRHQPNSQALLQNNGQQLISEIRSDLDNYVIGTKMPKRHILLSYERILNSLGLTSDTAYLYMQGHCIYDLVNRIGCCLMGNPNSFKTLVLDRTLQIGGYSEIDKLISDIRKVFP